MRNSWFMFFLAPCLVLSSPDIEARKGLGSLFKLSQGVKAINGAKHYSYNTLTVKQLSACISLEKRVFDSENKLNTEQLSVRKQEGKLKQSNYEISSLKNYLEVNKNITFYTQFQVDSFNLKVERYNSLISEYNTYLEAYRKMETTFNSMVKNHNHIVNNFQADCAGKQFYEDDLVAAKSRIN